MLKLINACKGILNIQYPVKISLQDRIYKGYLGVHWTEVKDSGKIKCHIIKISLKKLDDDVRGLETVLAHEILHAWQAEYKPNSVAHGRVFQNKSKELEDYLVSEGFAVSGIYRKKTDI